jgi:hypothetical protein
MTAGDIPFPFVPHSPSLAELISSNRRLLGSLKSFELSRLIASAAGLMTVPEWQSSTLRLEVLQHLIVFAAAGTKKHKKSHLKDWLNDLGGSYVGAMEDPAEDVHVSRVLIPGEDCLILEGV